MYDLINEMVWKSLTEGIIPTVVVMSMKDLRTLKREGLDNNIQIFNLKIEIKLRSKIHVR